MPQPPRKRPRKPSLDERLGAVIETLELVAGMQTTNEHAIEANARAIKMLNRNMVVLHDSIKSLERIASV